MFENIGGKIKALAKVFCWILIGISVLSGIIVMIAGNFLTGLLTAVLGALFSWIGNFVLYGFGQLIENSDIIVDKLDNKNNFQ